MDTSGVGSLVPLVDTGPTFVTTLVGSEKSTSVIVFDSTTGATETGLAVVSVVATASRFDFSVFAVVPTYASTLRSPFASGFTSSLVSDFFPFFSLSFASCCVSFVFSVDSDCLVVDGFVSDVFVSSSGIALGISTEETVVESTDVWGVAFVSVRSASA